MKKKNEKANETTEATKDLLLRVKEGDERAFEELSEIYKPLLSSLSLKYSAGTADREDGMQEALGALHRAAMHYRTDEAKVSFGFYAGICIRNALISRMRKESKHRTDEMRPYGFSTQDESPSDALLKREAKDKLVGRLSKFEREVFEMYSKGEKIRVIAEKTKRGAKAVYNALYRIRRKTKTDGEPAK